ncbi:RDD family protein [Rhodococcus triatomae]|uniref:RDD family protein n=1 Tax=Rhodococcus triatomae TaxID=300028 RepID=A0A1G8D8Y7_9NOCA|nr:RDD family protein [Rhodococcus triatomae]QNG18476.1 RDD family protein [Rhodococcus triatomae]QNG21855.1 RDD family protein [Rhodococcus triatomae]SDH54175.1 RDD family protein [Rhodococcus triatomae]
MGRITGSWLSGPEAALPPDSDGSAQAYRGERMGLPEHGPGAMVGPGRRLAGLMIDWLLAMGVAALLVGQSENPFEGQVGTFTLVVWFVVGVVTVSLFSFTPGQFVVGTQVARIDGPHRVGFRRALGRQALLSFVVPATISDGDGRGMHDRATGTAILRTR